MIGWLYRVLIGLDQLANALAGGSPDETISSRTGRSQSRLGRLLGGFLHLFERKHALKSIEYTPWGTVDPHDMPPVRGDLARDWRLMVDLLQHPEGPAPSEKDGEAAARAYSRLQYWTKTGGRERWRSRMEQDLLMGDRFQA